MRDEWRLFGARRCLLVGLVCHCVVVAVRVGDEVDDEAEDYEDRASDGLGPPQRLQAQALMQASQRVAESVQKVDKVSSHIDARISALEDELGRVRKLKEKAAQMQRNKAKLRNILMHQLHAEPTASAAAPELGDVDSQRYGQQMPSLVQTAPPLAEPAKPPLRRSAALAQTWQKAADDPDASAKEEAVAEAADPPQPGGSSAPPPAAPAPAPPAKAPSATAIVLPADPAAAERRINVMREAADTANNIRRAEADLAASMRQEKQCADDVARTVEEKKKTAAEEAKGAAMRAKQLKRPLSPRAAASGA
eukprot:TRINITY_DN4053_c0_g3_i1.p1 TRINITY_DN4053_c0_g3~~TRINITY_DN4053_c0_g3_i1.p1  ORF type:complete len:308 (+),score=103.00 TRINITY_DN4053_c0_g3_i1:107-1030(+)